MYLFSENLHFLLDNEWRQGQCFKFEEKNSLFLDEDAFQLLNIKKKGIQVFNQRLTIINNKDVYLFPILLKSHLKLSTKTLQLVYILTQECLQTFIFCQYFLSQYLLKKRYFNNQIYFEYCDMESDEKKQVVQSTEQPAPKKQDQKQQKKGAISERKLQMLNQYMEEKKKKHPDRKTLRYFEDILKKHQYWDNKPTLREDKDQPPGSIEGKREVKDVQKDPILLPREDLYWCDIDVIKEAELEQLYQLLTNNYVEDDDNTYRFDYSRQFLRWALTPPGYRPEWLVGVRDSTKKLVASITGVPVTVLVENDKIKMAEINFLCVHKQVREAKLAAFLITEVTRRVNLRDKWQAIYTSGKNLPTPFTRATYFHRSINPKKLIQVKFSALGQNQTMAMVKKLYSIPEELTFQLRPMNKNDVFGVAKLLNEGLSKYTVKFHYTDEQVKHYFLPRDKIVYTFVKSVDVVQNGKKKVKVTDFLSFYSLPSHVMKNPKHDMLYACYSFYNFATSVPYEELIRNALILAKKEGFDVYNCLNLMDNATVYQNLHFQTGDGVLNYYLYNWILKSRKIEPNQLGIVLF